jgi:hypothetical protein
MRLARNASGNAYVGLSGGVTINSGSYPLSGGGLLDGVILGPGDTYYVPKLGCSSGTLGIAQIYLEADAAVSGQGRIYWEIY